MSSFYKPLGNDEKSLSELWKLVKKIPKNSMICILGDFNMLELNWSDESLKHTCTFKTLYEDLCCSSMLSGLCVRL